MGSTPRWLFNQMRKMMSTDERMAFEKEIAELEYKVRKAERKSEQLAASVDEIRREAQSKIEELRAMLQKSGNR